MKSVYLQKDKTIFKVKELPAEEFAASMGLPGAPQIKFEDGKKAKIRSAPKAAEAQQPREEDLDAMVAGSDEEEEEAELEEDEEAGSEQGDESGSEEDEEDEVSGSDEEEEAAPVRIS